MQLKRTDDYENSILVVIILHTGRDTTKCNLSITQMQAGQRDAGQSPSGYEVGPGSYRVTYIMSVIGTVALSAESLGQYHGQLCR